MSRRISSFTACLGVLLAAAGVSAAPSYGPVEKGLQVGNTEHNAKKPKGKKGADADEAAEEAEAEEKPKKKGKKGKKAAEEEEAEPEEEKPKKKGKKGKKAAEEEEAEPEEEKPKKKGKKGKKEEPPPEEEAPVDLKDTESGTETPEEAEELPEEAPAEEAPSEAAEEGEKAEAAASVSSADAAGKLFIGLRLGYGLFMGKTTGDLTPVEFSGKIPIWLDLGYRFTPNILAALYGEYGFVSMKCPTDGAVCSASAMRFGVQAQYNFSPEASFQPWAGFGVGYEMANGEIKYSDFSTKFSLTGIEFANLQAGADFEVAKGVGVGPFLSFSIGRYSSGEVELTGFPAESGGISKKEFHEWLVLGVRGAFSL